MWKNLIFTGHQATRTIRYPQPASRLWAPAVSSSTQRSFSAAARHQKQSEDFDREALQPDSSEAVKTGTDSEIAQHDAAYDPSNTSPESEMKATEQESQQQSKSGTLNVSGANQDVNKWRGPREGGPDRNAEKKAPSGRGSPKKGREIHVKEDGTHVAYR